MGTQKGRGPRTWWPEETIACGSFLWEENQENWYCRCWRGGRSDNEWSTRSGSAEKPNEMGTEKEPLAIIFGNMETTVSLSRVPSVG